MLTPGPPQVARKSMLIGGKYLPDHYLCTFMHKLHTHSLLDAEFMVVFSFIV